MKKGYVISVILLLIVATFIWGVSSKEKQFIREVKDYLDQKYPIKMNLIDEPTFSFELGNYSILASPEGMDYITFAAYQSAHKKGEYGDRFAYELWTYQANIQLNQLIHQAKFECDVTGRFSMIGGIDPAILYEGSMPKPYEEVKTYLGPGTKIHIKIDNSLNDSDIETLFYLLSLIMEKELQFARMSITFNGDKERFFFNFNEIDSLATSHDLRNLLMN